MWQIKQIPVSQTQILAVANNRNPGERAGKNTRGFQKDLPEKFSRLKAFRGAKKLYAVTQSSLITSLPKSGCHSTRKSENS